MISRGFASAFLSACMLLAAEGGSQSVPQSSPSHSSAQQHEDQSFNLGTAVTHPEDFSGLWEAPDGHGGAVGIHLLLDTTAPIDATTLVGTPQKWLGLQANPYRRAGAEIQENSFGDSPRGGGVRYEDGRLTLHFPGYDLDLHRIAGDKWSGRFHREGFDSVVILARPMLRTEANQPWFVGAWPVGAWKSVTGSDITCLHIAKSSSAGFLAWSDSLSTEGSTSFPPGIPRPPYSWEHYGELVKVQSAANGGVSVELAAYSPTCCSHRFLATPADHGKTMKADWPAGSSHSPYKSKWTKMPADTCIAPPG